MGPKPANTSAKPAAKGVIDPAARDKKIGIILFVIDGLILLIAVLLFATAPTCTEDFMDDVQYEDFNISDVGSIEIQNWGHETPLFNQFQPSSYGSSSYGSSSPSTSSFWSSIFGSGSSTPDTGSSQSSSYGSGSTYGTGSSGYGYGESYGPDATSLGGDSLYGYGTGSTYGSAYGTGSSSYSSSYYGSSYGTGSSSYGTGSSHDSSYATGFSSYGSGSTYDSIYGTGFSGTGNSGSYGPDVSSLGDGSSSGHWTDSSYGSYGTGSTYGSNYGSGSSSPYGSSSGSASSAFGSYYGSSSPDYGTDSSSSGGSVYGTGSSGSYTSTGTDSSGWGTGSTSGTGSDASSSGSGLGAWMVLKPVSPSGSVTSLVDQGITVGIGGGGGTSPGSGTSPNSGPDLAPGETLSYWVYKPVSPSPSGGSGVGSSFGVAPSPDGSSSQITGINSGFGSGFGTGSSGSGGSSGSSWGSGGSPSGGSTAAGGPYKYADLVDMIPEDRFTNTNFQCGVSKVKPNLRPGRVVGGTVAIAHSWPWAVSLMRRYEPDAFGNPFLQHMCGATLVSPRHVISALHCFTKVAESVDDNGPKGDYKRKRRVYVGKHEKEKGGEEYEIALIRQHPKGLTKPVAVYDIVLITTAKEIVFNDKIQPVCLPKFKAEKAHGTWCWAYGWGSTGTSGGEAFLKQVHLEIGNAAACAKSFPQFPNVERLVSPNIAVCAGTEKGQDTCQGDSGGPLTCQEDGKTVLYGATSYGNECGSGDYAVYASVSYALEWFCCYMAEIPGCQGVSCNPRGYN